MSVAIGSLQAAFAVIAGIGAGVCVQRARRMRRTEGGSREAATILLVVGVLLFAATAASVVAGVMRFLSV